jgi:hypothetical protein
MIKFQHFVDQESKVVHLSGELFYRNYPVNLQDINKEYFIDTFIQSFKPFLQLQKPIDQDPNFTYFKLRPLGKLLLDFSILYPNSLKKIHISLVYFTSSKSVSLEYKTSKVFRESSRKRYREEVEEEGFLQNVLNAMVRFLNTIIKDYSKIVMSPRLILDRFLGPVEQNLAQFLGTTVLRY